MFTLKESIVNVEYDVFHIDGKHMGKMKKDVDGFYYFWPNKTDGAWPSYALINLGQLLQNLNSAWEKEILKYNETVNGKISNE